MVGMLENIYEALESILESRKIHPFFPQPQFVYQVETELESAFLVSNKFPWKSSIYFAKVFPWAACD